MAIQFETLFSIKVLHDFYDRHESQCADFRIVPAPDCENLMKNARMLFRNSRHQLQTLISAEKKANTPPTPGFQTKPFIPMGKELVFRFYMLLYNPHFSKFTATGMNMSARKRYCFSNLSNNANGSTLSLSKAIAAHDTGKIYWPGDLVKATDGNLFEALRTSDGTAGATTLSDVKYWQQAGTNGLYANSQDEVVLCGEVFHYQLKTPDKNIDIKIFGLDKTSSAMPHNQLLKTVLQNFDADQQTVKLDLSGLATGKYRIVVNNEGDNWVYIDQEAVQQNAYGIIEIHQLAQLPIAFQLLTASGELAMPGFTIHFKSRSVFWKYTSQNGNIGVVDSAAAPIAFVPASAATVQSERAIALRETPVATLTASKAGSTKTQKNLGNPQPDKLVLEKDGNNSFYAANMHVKID
jgi:hypothetical protein